MTLLSARGMAIPGRLNPTDLDAPAGQRIALIGPNGGGKTSLLRALAGVEGSSGTIAVNGQPIERFGGARARLLSLMGASRDIGWPIPVADVVALGLPSADPRRISDLLDQLELTALATRPVSRLSTGERARVLMARAIAGQAPLLLLDEPLSNLDPYWVLRFLEMFDRLAAAGATLICALHDLALLERFDRALLIADGQVVADRAPREMLADSMFEQNFGIVIGGDGRPALSPSADRRSLR